MNSNWLSEGYSVVEYCDDLDYIVIKLTTEKNILQLTSVDLNLSSSFKNPKSSPIKSIHHPTGMLKFILFQGINEVILRRERQYGLINKDFVDIISQEDLIFLINGARDSIEKWVALQRANRKSIFGYRYNFFNQRPFRNLDIE